MMRYFAKLLPVKGEYRKGDRMNSVNGEIPGTLHVRLFLCSRDLQEGEKAYCLGEEAENRELGLKEGDKQWVNPWCTKGDCPDCVKVLGEISPEATWVKDGDEFGEDDIQLFITDPNDPDWFADYYCKEDWSEELEMGFTIVAKIRCSNCKHFH